MCGGAYSAVLGIYISSMHPDSQGTSGCPLASHKSEHCAEKPATLTLSKADQELPQRSPESENGFFCKQVLILKKKKKIKSVLVCLLSHRFQNPFFMILDMNLAQVLLLSILVFNWALGVGNQRRLWVDDIFVLGHGVTGDFQTRSLRLASRVVVQTVPLC